MPIFNFTRPWPLSESTCSNRERDSHSPPTWINTAMTKPTTMFTMLAVAAIALTPVKFSAQAPEPQATPDESTPEEQSASVEEDTPPEQSVPTDEDTPVEESTPDQNSIQPPMPPAITPPAQSMTAQDQTPEPAASPSSAEVSNKPGSHGNYGWIGLLGLLGLAGLLPRRHDPQSRRYRST